MPSLANVVVGDLSQRQMVIDDFDVAGMGLAQVA